MTLPNFQILAELGCDGPHVVYRGHRRADGASALLKTPLRHPARAADIEGLNNEYALLGELCVPGVPKAYELFRNDGRWWLAFEDSGGAPLASLLLAGRIDLPFFLHIGLQLASILAALHRLDVVHKNVQPESIFVHPATRGLTLGGFALATRSHAETPSPLAAGRLAGALTYISPEQTGRMNRAIDYRSDLYSLGVVLYELLTGAPPFRSKDPLELIHAHIARSPPPPSGLQPALPEPVSQIVMKLLEKTAEARYQSAQGLKADLEICAREWNGREQIAPFALGAHDLSDRFLIPQQLYGRDKEVAELVNAFDRTCAGPAALMLVSGYSGVGKTSLIQELYGPVVRRRGYFISGKFDQVVRNVPYGALLQAFRDLVQQLLTESEERLEYWRTRLADALGDNGGVLSDVIPEIELITGPQAPVPPLAPAQAQNRFRLVFQNFVGAVASEQHPLVVFLDDLQWADAASLALLQLLLTGPELSYLYLIGTYRDNEVDAGHLLSRTVAALDASGATIERIELAPLGSRDLQRFVGDCLGRHDAEIEKLARLVSTKTEGNPFFVIQFLKTLWIDGLVRFDHDERRWTFDIEDIARAPVTDNVIDLMSHKIQRLPAATQELLTLAACVGNPFDLQTLAVISRQTPAKVTASLQQALRAGLVLRVASSGPELEAAAGEGASAPVYAFLHDRVQQAAYARLPEDSRQQLHLTVGRLLLERWDPDTAEDKLFDIVGHLNLGRALIGDEPERLVLARYNLRAGLRAKTSTAYHAALSYFEAGLALLAESHWRSHYPLMFELQREAAECEYLCGRFDAAEQRFEQLLARARTDLDKAQVYDLRVVQYENMSRYPEAARIGRDGVALFGVSFPEDEPGKRDALEAEMQVIDRLLDGRRIESLVDLPVLSNPEIAMVLRLLTDTWAPAYISGDGLLVALISARIVSLSIEHGNTEDSAYGYVTHAISVGPLRGQYQAAYEWGTLALLVNERFADQKRRAKIHQQFNAHVTLWRRPLQTCIYHAQEACRSGLQAGDFAYAGYGAMSEAWPAFLVSHDLERFIRDYAPTLGLLQRIRTSGLAAIHGVMLSWARALQGRTDERLSLTDASFDESAFISAHGQNPFFMTVFYIAKLHLAVLFEEHAAAVTAAERARELGPWGHGTIWPVLLDFWGGLAMTAAYGAADEETRGRYRQQLERGRQELALLAENCAENFRCYSLLLDAEMRRIEGRLIEALELCEEAIRYAQQTQNLQQEALAQELCGRLWLSRGNESGAAACLGEADRCYGRWGAAAKVQQLEQKYRQLRPLATQELSPALDVASVTKAAHALAEEIVLDELLRKLMRIALENAGADRGLFIQEKDGQLYVAAEGSLAQAEVSVEAAPLSANTRLPKAVVQYVRNTGQSVVSGNAASDRRFAADPYIVAVRPKSILCTPIVHQGKSSGILYLENNLATDAFTADRINVLEILASPAAISLENARLYREKTEEVERRKIAEDELRAALAQVESLKNRLQAENIYLQAEIDEDRQFRDIIGASTSLRAVLDQVEIVAATDATVLILGETGTGKELIARAIHERSRRCDSTLVRLNCSAISAGLVESELFGHVKGAFTGAHDRRVGRFQIADGGTIFLDEIAELPLETQAKLLRVLQEQEFEAVGSSQTMRVDVRVIAATNRDLAAEIASGRFRTDLFYRLNVFPITMPPLRERRGDVPLLAGFFLARNCQRLGRKIEGFTEEAMAELKRYSWPGNVRELQNVIERAVVLCTSRLIGRDMILLPAQAAAEQAQPAAAAPAEARAAETGRRLSTLEEIERTHITAVLRRTGGVIEGPNGAARILDLTPSTTRFRMKKLGIRREDYAA